LERNPITRIFFQRRAIGRNRLLKTPRPALPLPKRAKPLSPWWRSAR
jgi:hypothetical protein